MNIGLIDVDGKMPNLALMKISAWHKKQGDSVEWYNGLCKYDKVYMSKVFTFTEDYSYYINAGIIEKGGTGYDFFKELPVDIDRTFPEYSISGGCEPGIRFFDTWMPEQMQMVYCTPERRRYPPLYGYWRDNGKQEKGNPDG